jgi:outer membrane protein assembly factor BamB
MGAKRASACPIRSWARSLRIIGLALLATGAAAGCTAGGPTQPSSTGAGTSRTLGAPGKGGPAAAPAAVWPTFGRDTARTGGTPRLHRPGRLSVAWRARLDGAVYGQPLLIGNLVVVATEHDTVYALSTDTGKVAWHTHVGTPVPRGVLPCGNIDPLGITGTPAYDPSTGIVYAVAETTGYRHTLFGLSATNGAIKVERYIPTPDGQQRYDQQRPALTVAGGRVYVAFGGLAGDCGPYRGSVVGVPATGRGPIISYVVPTSREAGIWAPGGPVLGPDRSFYLSTGNGAADRPGLAYDRSDSVTRLTLSLSVLGFFAPTTWADDNAHDLDLGSTQPALAGNAAFAVGKRGVGYLAQAGALGGIGGNVAEAPVCKAFGTAAVHLSTVYEPCTDAGLTAVSVNVATKQIRILWRGPAGAHGSPSIGGGAIWVPDSRGRLYALSPVNGSVLQSVSLGVAMPRFSSVSLSGSRAYLGTLSGVVAVAGA